MTEHHDIITDLDAVMRTDFEPTWTPDSDDDAPHLDIGTVGSVRRVVYAAEGPCGDIKDLPVLIDHQIPLTFGEAQHIARQITTTVHDLESNLRGLRPPMPTPTAFDVAVELFAGSVGTVCDIDGAVHIHCPMNANSDSRHTARLLHEVAEERGAQRIAWGNDHDDWHTRVQEAHDVGAAWPDRDEMDWDELHLQRLAQVRVAEGNDGRREQLVKAAAVYLAEAESIDRTTQGA